MKKIDLKEIKKIIDKSELCEVVWQAIDNRGDSTTEEGVKEANMLRDKLANAIYRRLK